MATHLGDLHRITVEPEARGLRLDVYLAHRLSLSRSRIQQLIEAGEIRVHGRVVRPSYRIRTGDEVQVRIPPPEPVMLVPEPLPVRIRYEDADLAVVDKPAGIAVHPGAGRTRGTLVNALLARLDRLSGIGGELRPGIVHRLDKDTSGLLVVAKHDAAHAALASQFARRMARRTYLALLRGEVPWEEKTVSAPIGRHPVRRKEMAVIPTGRPATTHFRVVERFPGYTLVACQLKTGRTHQVRVHARYMGYPVAGDPVYGARGELGLGRQFLHASELVLVHPRTGERLVFTSELPEELQQVLRALREGRSERCGCGRRPE
ncbi:MAG: RluA family pseudouridine synthase [Armatimonadota bacterium]|nr:RluA family pseudouridine synthase [Armatimonadota bacterium]MDR7438836.1 RluA family pseudouridine synthase [Armatimonadota bacterium]MDR7563962.1 RluA family pseudouridine synthase [Armatimonadota bacterium]MDR7568673.1 RluA family pseudouridine synthase [Armatimonadota bacterium]MDR7602210.1 RluA family pseudouridine synthase [Armatimonadota bacterium]